MSCNFDWFSGFLPCSATPNVDMKLLQIWLLSSHQWYPFLIVVLRGENENVDPGRTWTCNPLIRSQMPYPLGHRTSGIKTSAFPHFSFNHCNHYTILSCRNKPRLCLKVSTKHGKAIFTPWTIFLKFERALAEKRKYKLVCCQTSKKLLLLSFVVCLQNWVQSPKVCPRISLTLLWGRVAHW